MKARPERFPPDDPREWLNRARSSLALAKSRVPDAYWEDLCFEAQQAAEKALKAVLLHRGIKFPYVHDLGRLLALLGEDRANLPTAVLQAGGLTRYAVVTRYPGAVRPLSEDDYRDALAVATAMLSWAESQVRSQTDEKSPAGSSFS